MQSNCPPETVCLTYDEYDEIVMMLQEAEIAYEPIEMSDTAHMIQLGWDILFLSPWELIYISLPMSVLAIYGLSIYAGYLWVKRKVS